jgi:hypothetical protein
MINMTFSRRCKRSHMFLFGCIGVRLGLAVLAYHYLQTNNANLQYLIALTLAIAASWIILYTCKMRQTGFEASAEDDEQGQIWWDHLRPIHALLYVAFAVLACNGVKWAWVLLLLDALFGLERWVHQRMC